MKITPLELKKRYASGENISALLRDELSLEQNTREIIEIAYDLQAGEYTEAISDPAVAEHKQHYAAELAGVIHSLCRPVSVLEAGVGEATTLCGLLDHLDDSVSSYGFDLSWSRVALARENLHRRTTRSERHLDSGKVSAQLCTGDLFDIPFLDNAVDIVYTSHSIEPNGGHEKRILQELYRVARRYLILLEPGYELASEKARQRMDSHGYCKGLRETALALGYPVLRHELFPSSINPLNPTAVTLIQKAGDATPSAEVFACPRCKTPLRDFGSALYSPQALVAYPVLGDIACLRIENGILASRFEEMTALQSLPE